MHFEDLVQFLERDMRMSHVYQPVMLRLLLGRNGRASIQDVARALLNDRSQLEYYSEITRNMVGRVLANRAVVKREGGDYELLGHDRLTAEQVQELKAFAIGSSQSISPGAVRLSGNTVGEALATSVGPCVMKFLKARSSAANFAAFLPMSGLWRWTTLRLGSREGLTRSATSKPSASPAMR